MSQRSHTVGRGPGFAEAIHEKLTQIGDTGEQLDDIDEKVDIIEKIYHKSANLMRIFRRQSTTLCATPIAEITKAT